MGLVCFYVFVVRPVSTTQGNFSAWTSTTNLPRGIANFTVVTKDDRIYVIGGGLTPPNGVGSPPPIADVYYAQTLANGYLSGWTTTTSLPIPLAGHAAVITNSTIYVIGGDSGQKDKSGNAVLSKNTFYGTVQPNGQLGVWKKSTSVLPFGVSAHSVFAKDGYLYVISGYNTDQIASSHFVLRATIQQDGDIGAWENDPSWNLPQSTYRHTSEIFEDNVYVIGGRKRNGSIIEPSKSVYVGKIPHNNVNGWATAATLPQSLYFHSSILSKAKQKIYTFGGFDGSFETDKVYNSSIKQNGNLSSWTEDASLKLPIKIFRHSAILPENGSIYVFGGKKDEVHTSGVYFIPPLVLNKSSTPSGPIHEADTITYTIAYANNSFITQTMSITDVIPFNVKLLPDSISDAGQLNGSTIVWNLGDISPGNSGQVSFQVKVPLFLNSKKTPVSLEMIAARSSVSHVLPSSVTCDTTEFWAIGVTPLPQTNSQTIQVQIPPNINPTEIWLLMKYTNNMTPTVAGQPAELVTTNSNSFGASLWSATVSRSALDNGQLTIVTQNPRNLNAIFLFDKGDPPFDKSELEAFQNTTKSFTYTLDIPSVTTQTIDVIIPFMDITHHKTNGQPDNRSTSVTVTYNGHTLRPFTVDNPNQGNGLLMSKFPINIGPISGDITSVATVAVTVDTEDSIYTLGPRICRPVYIANTAWLCSKQAGCITDTAINKPPNIKYPVELFLPILMKNGS